MTATATDASPLQVTLLPQEPNVKRAPATTIAGRSLRFQYASSTESVDSNLLILLHGLGDTSRSLFALGQKLQKTLPQTAIMSLQGTEKIPLLPEEACCYWQCLDPVMGDLVSKPNPSDFLFTFEALLEHLIEVCGWPPEGIHLFGFAHGATAALEGAISWSRKQRRRSPRNDEAQNRKFDQTTHADRIGSIVSICGSLLSIPTFAPPISTPVLHWHRQAQPAQATSPSASTIKFLKRAFANVQDSPVAMQPGASAMPASKLEWDPIMHFWSRTLRNRSAWERSGDVFTLASADGSR